MDGSVAVLSTRSDNYYHFMLDSLPRLGLLEDTRPLETLDAFLVRARQPFQRELLELCGVPADRILDSATHRHVQARRLVVPSIPALRGQTPPWVARVPPSTIGGS